MLALAVVHACVFSAMRLSPKHDTPCLPQCGNNPTTEECANCCRTVRHETDWKCDASDAAGCCVGSWDAECWDVASDKNRFHACNQCSMSTPPTPADSVWAFNPDTRSVFDGKGVPRLYWIETPSGKTYFTPRFATATSTANHAFLFFGYGSAPTNVEDNPGGDEDIDTVLVISKDAATKFDGWVATTWLNTGRQIVDSKIIRRLDSASASDGISAYVSGGVGTDYIVDDSVWKCTAIDTASGVECTELPAMTHKRKFHTMVVYRDHLWAIGGKNADFSTTTTEKLNLLDTSAGWTAGPPLDESGAVYHSISAVVLENRIVVLGGLTNKGEDSRDNFIVNSAIFIFDGNSWSIQEITLPLSYFPRDGGGSIVPYSETGNDCNTYLYLNNGLYYTGVYDSETNLITMIEAEYHIPPGLDGNRYLYRIPMINFAKPSKALCDSTQRTNKKKDKLDLILGLTFGGAAVIALLSCGCVYQTQIKTWLGRGSMAGENAYAHM